MNGSESFGQGSSSLIVQLVPCTALQLPEGKPVFVGDAAKRALGGVNIPAGRPVYVPASRTGLKEQGAWFDGNYELPTGTILRVCAQRRERVGGRTGHALPPKNGTAYIRIRADAALRRLTLKTIDSEQSADVPVVIEGRFDVLSLREVGAAGVRFDQNDVLSTKADAVRGVLDHTEIASELQRQQKTVRESVETPTGERVSVDVTRRPRAINLD